MRAILKVVSVGFTLVLVLACTSTEPPPQLNPGKSMRAAAAAALEVYGAQLSQMQNVRGELPQGDGVQVLMDAGIRVVPRTDPFGTEMKFHNDGTHWILSSAGPDMKWDTPDDIVIEDGLLR